MSKKVFSVLFAVLMIMTLLLAACAPATPEPTTEPEPAKTDEPAPVETEEMAEPMGSYEEVDPSGQVVTYWHQHSRSREEALLAIIEEFNTTNEYGITVVAEYQGGYGDIFNKMLVVLNTADAPNMVVAYQNQSATYAVAEAMVDMNDLVNSPKWGLTEEEQADFFPGFFAQDVFPTFGNARYGFPPNRSMEMMYYNAEWLNELKDAGAIDFDGPPTTPEQFRAAACAAVENPFSKAVAEGSIGYELSVDASRYASWTFAFGGNVFDYEAGQYSYDDEAAVAAMEFLQGLFDDGCATIVTERYGDQTDFGTGKLLFTVGSTSGLPFYGSAIEAGVGEFDWNVAPVPHTTEEPVTNIYGASIGIPKTTPEGELAAWLTLKHLTSPDQQAAWAEASNYFPVRFSVADGLGDLFASLPQYETGYSFLEYGKFEPPTPGYDFVRDMAEEAMAAITEGADVASTLATLNADANANLDEYSSFVPEPVPTDTPEPTPEPIGTADHPIKVLFVPSVDAAEIVTGGELLAATLKEATGLEFEVSVPTSYAATIEEMCASPTDTMGFIPGLGYVLANQLCGVDVAAKAVRFGYDWYAAQVLVGRDSGLETLADLNGLKWAYPDPGSTSGYLYPLQMFKDAGVEPGETLEAGGHTGVVRAIYNGEADFGTSFFSPPRVDGEAIVWEPGDDPDVPADLLESCDLTDDGGTIMCDNFEPRDARRNLREEAPDVMQKVRILATTPKIPNDTISFGPDFDADLREQIVAAIFEFATNDPEGFATAMDPYSWTGVNPALDEEYDPIRLGVEAAGFTLEDLGE